MKVLVVAYACEPGRGSEGEIGWRLVHELAVHHDVYVITRANLRSVHERWYASNKLPSMPRIDYYDLPWIFRFYKKGARLFLLYYYLWQLGAGIRGRRSDRVNNFDIKHHLTGGMDWMPSGLALCRGPFLWGPIGSENTHPVIRRELGLRARIADVARGCLRGLMRHLDPFTRLTGARASIILSHTPENLASRLRTRVREAQQTGIVDHPEMARPKAGYERGVQLRLIYAGELKAWKGADLAVRSALEAFQRGVDGSLTVIGDGPLMGKLRMLTASHAHGHRVTFRGRLSMEQLVESLRHGDIFLYPSYHHGLATIVLQAMLTGLPIVCIEGDAIGRTIKQRAGLTVALSEDASTAGSVASAIERLNADEQLRRRLARSAREIALEEHSYEVMAAALAERYKEAQGDLD